MNYLAEEIDSTLAEHALEHRKLGSEELNEMISTLRIHFFDSGAKSLDPIHLKNPEKAHDPDFWQKVDQLEDLHKPILIVTDNEVHAWELHSTSDLKTLFSETTGFPFWITDINHGYIAYMDDHDCVHSLHRQATQAAP